MRQNRWIMSAAMLVAVLMLNAASLAEEEVRNLADILASELAEEAGADAPNEPTDLELEASLPARDDAEPANEAAADDAPDLPAAETEPEVEDGITVENGILMNFRDVPLETVLDHLSEAAGLVIVKNVDIDGRITVINRQPLETHEAIMVINSVLYEMGYAAIRSGRTLRIVTHDQAKRSNIPVRVGNSPERIEETDEVITQVIPIRHADASQLINDLEPLISTDADLTANASSNAMIMTDTSANIRRIVEVVAALDTAISSVASVEVFGLEYANATDAARLINEIFRDGAQQQQDPRRRAAEIMFGRGGGPQRRGGGNDDESGGRADVRVNAAADERTNTIVVTGPQETLAVVGELLKELDENPMASQGVFVYRVRNGRATNLQLVLETLFNGAAANGQRRGQPARPRRGEAVEGDPGGRPATRQQQPGGQQQQQPQQRQQQPGGGGGFRERMLRELSGETEQNAFDLLGQVQVVADEDTNAILVMTAPGNFDQVREIIEELDRPVPQVVIKALIAEVTHTDALDLGAEFSILDVPGDSSLFTDFGVAAATGGLTYRLLETNIEATVRALQEVGKLEVLSRPYILASDNQEAIITVGAEVPLPISQTFSDIGVGARTQFRYEDIGIILRVTPHVNPDGRVTMDVFPEISALSPDRIEIGAEFAPPIINKRSAESRVAVDDGQTIVIGGLMEDQKSETVRKVPLLGDIPILGHAFRRTETETTKTELLIFLTPHVATDREALDELSAGERDRVRLVPDAIEEGAYERHLEGLERWDPSSVNDFNGLIEPETDVDLDAGTDVDLDADLEED